MQRICQSQAAKVIEDVNVSLYVSVRENKERTFCSVALTQDIFRLRTGTIFTKRVATQEKLPLRLVLSMDEARPWPPNCRIGCGYSNDWDVIRWSRLRLVMLFSRVKVGPRWSDFPSPCLTFHDIPALAKPSRGGGAGSWQKKAKNSCDLQIYLRLVFESRTLNP